MGKKSSREDVGTAESFPDIASLNNALTNLSDQIEGLFEQISFATFLTDDAGRCLSINNQALIWIGCARESIVGKLSPEEFHAAENWKKLKECTDYPATQSATERDLELIDGKNERRHFKVCFQNFLGSDKNPAVQRVVFYDVTDYNRMKERERIAAIAFESKMGICVTDKNELILEVNEAFSKITGFVTKDLRGQHYDLFFSQETKSDSKDGITKALAAKGFWEGEVLGSRSDGSRFVVWMNVSSVPMRNEPIHYYVICLYDITRSKAVQDEIHNLAYFDTLTQLPNRRKLNDRLKRILSVIPRSHLYGAVLFIDLDNFKSLNDTKGHAIGDLLLIEVGQRLQRAVRERDMVARVGGDEFVVVLDDLSINSDEASYQANLIGSKIQDVLSSPFCIDDFVFNFGGSIGISIFGQGDVAEDVIQQADMAMYRAKREGRNSLCFYDPAMRKAASDYLHLEQELGKAIELGQLQLFYQPQFNYLGKILGVEALLRWQHPERGLVVPDDFIPLAEASGLILSIGLWVLERACEQMKQWQSDPLFSKLEVAINVSARQFKDEDFVDNVIRIIKTSRVNPSQLKIELTESMVHDVDVMRKKMEKIRQLGVRFSLDDFGTGYSSLASLIKLPLEQLKIDQSFISNMLTSTGDSIVVKTIISMASNLGVEVIAEGLETEIEKDFLNSLGCSLYQGYLLSPPLPAEALEEFIKNVVGSQSDAPTVQINSASIFPTKS
jgi:diguanylate cyclase (GGDEF)-like protein/PAS domain S-box-containing protein